tara:strand:+ start:123 stop:428 length:306 start_codon:yes stop_codon:yes gene_type:complete
LIKAIIEGNSFFYNFNYFFLSDKKKKLFTISEVIRGDEGFSPTNSLIFIRKALLKLPKWFYEDTHAGDLYRQIFVSMNGGALYIPQNMTVYRVNSMGSWSR